VGGRERGREGRQVPFVSVGPQEMTTFRLNVSTFNEQLKSGLEGKEEGREGRRERYAWE